MNLLKRFARDVLRRVDMTIAYVRSAFDDPNAGDKASMARICAAAAIYGALRTTAALVRFAFENKESVGMAGILAGAAATLGCTLGYALLSRKGGDGSTAAVNDTPPAPSNDLKLTASLSSTSADVKP
jgi:hypothetical protein